MAVNYVKMDDDISLSSHAQRALAEFLAEQEQAKSTVKEDWQLSQFWYADETAEWLATQLLKGATADTWIALVSAPSVLPKLKQLNEVGAKIALFEYDRRFASHTEFYPYDFNYPLDMPADLKGKFNRILLDPPFLSDECQIKTAATCRWLTTSAKIIVCTGLSMGELVPKIYPGVTLQSYEPKHCAGLSNPFGCWANTSLK